jgi:hypothetical protein
MTVTRIGITFPAFLRPMGLNRWVRLLFLEIAAGKGEPVTPFMLSQGRSRALRTALAGGPNANRPIETPRVRCAAGRCDGVAARGRGAARLMTEWRSKIGPIPNDWFDNDPSPVATKVSTEAQRWTDELIRRLLRVKKANRLCPAAHSRMLMLQGWFADSPTTTPYTTRRDLGGRSPACPESSFTVRMDVVPHCSQTYDTSTKPFESIISLGSPGIIARLQPGHITTGSVRIRSGRLPLIQ